MKIRIISRNNITYMGDVRGGPDDFEEFGKWLLAGKQDWISSKNWFVHTSDIESVSLVEGD